MRLTRIYCNGEKRTLDSNSKGFNLQYGSVEHWQEYNQQFRFGCAQFIDGECVYEGIGHSQTDLQRYAEEEKALMRK